MNSFFIKYYINLYFIYYQMNYKFNLNEVYILFNN